VVDPSIHFISSNTDKGVLLNLSSFVTSTCPIFQRGRKSCGLSMKEKGVVHPSTALELAVALFGYFLLAGDDPVLDRFSYTVLGRVTGRDSLH
jgi:hypothetical protein